MKASEVRRKYIEFFKSSPRNHLEISPAPLVLENDPTTLFTSSGMQPLVPYLMGQPHPEGKRLVDSQPSIRLQDIDEVGDNRHTTFFEMLGNWSLGDYFKKEQLAWFLEFLTKDLGLEKERLWISAFEGNDQVPKDEETTEIWKSLGIPDSRIYYYGVEKNWWSKSGTPSQMPIGEIGGPDSEVFFEFTQVKHDPKYGRECHPNCDCGRFLEVGNSVFMQYKKVGESKLEELPNKNVDFGGGLERLTAATLDNPDIFTIDLFWAIIQTIQKISGRSYEGNEKPMRIIADHLRAAVMLISSGIIPSNKSHGDVLRSLISGAVNQISNELKIKERLTTKIVEEIIDVYKESYPEVAIRKTDIQNILDQEEIRFYQKIESGLPKFKTEFPERFSLSSKEDAKKLIEHDVKPFNLTADNFLTRYKSQYGSYISLPSVAAGTATFYGTSTYGLPFQEMTPVLQQNWTKAKVISEIEKADTLMKDLQKDQSRTQSAGMFKGGLADHSTEVTRLHTVTHLLHASLRKILGEHVQQKGSNITSERLRFDFSHSQKLTDDEIEKVEGLTNKVIDKDLPVSFETKTYQEAIGEGALAFFGERYGEKVNVYTIGDFSKEVCGGPHVKKTSEIGHVKITKQEKIGSGLIRIYAILKSKLRT